MGLTEKRLCSLKVVRQQEETQLNRGGRVKENKLAVYFWNCILTLLNLRRKGQTHLLKTWGVELSLVYDFYRHLIERVKSSVRENAWEKPWGCRHTSASVCLHTDHNLTSSGNNSPCHTEITAHCSCGEHTHVNPEFSPSPLFSIGLKPLSGVRSHMVRYQRLRTMQSHISRHRDPKTSPAEC